MLEVDQGNLRLTHFYDPSITDGEVHIKGGLVDPNDPYKSIFPNIQETNLIDSSRPKVIIDARGFREFVELIDREYS